MADAHVNLSAAFETNLCFASATPSAVLLLPHAFCGRLLPTFFSSSICALHAFRADDLLVVRQRCLSAETASSISEKLKFDVFPRLSDPLVMIRFRVLGLRTKLVAVALLRAGATPESPPSHASFRHSTPKHFDLFRLLRLMCGFLGLYDGVGYARKSIALEDFSVLCLLIGWRFVFGGTASGHANRALVMVLSFLFFVPFPRRLPVLPNAPGSKSSNPAQLPQMQR